MREDYISPTVLIRRAVTEGELLAQTAEEAAELAQAALKLRRTLTNDNPTPMDHSHARANLLEEIADVMLCIRMMPLTMGDWGEVEKTIAAKTARWAERLRERGAAE